MNQLFPNGVKSAKNKIGAQYFGSLKSVKVPVFGKQQLAALNPSTSYRIRLN